jgi:hypothetical protein
MPAGMPSKRNATDSKGKTGRKIFLRFRHLSASFERISRLQLTEGLSDSVAEITVSNAAFPANSGAPFLGTGNPDSVCQYQRASAFATSGRAMALRWFLCTR